MIRVSIHGINEPLWQEQNQDIIICRQALSMCPVPWRMRLLMQALQHRQSGCILANQCTWLDETYCHKLRQIGQSLWRVGLVCLSRYHKHTLTQARSGAHARAKEMRKSPHQHARNIVRRGAGMRAGAGQGGPVPMETWQRFSQFKFFPIFSNTLSKGIGYRVGLGMGYRVDFLKEIGFWALEGVNTIGKNPYSEN